MQSTQASGTNSRPAVILAGLVILLSAPSIWFITTVPPLWRDVDAYIQTTGGVDTATVLLHGPLYTFLARLPLFLGHLLESGAGTDARSLGEFLLRPTLTDSGVFALVLVQHAALLASQFYFVVTVARAGWIRLLLAIILAANPMLYAFAHCIGSEALSAIGFVLLAAVGLRIVRAGGGATVYDWAAFGVVLVLLMLTRQINAALAGLLPLALLPLLYQRRGSNEAVSTPALRPLLFAIATGAACFAISVACVRLIASNAEMPYRSKIGYTFMWRLKFLQELSPTERQRVVTAAASRARSPEAKGVIEALPDAFAHREPPDVTQFIRERRAALLPRGTPEAAARIDEAMNEMPLAFLSGSPAALVTAATEDFLAARKTSVWRVTEFLFETTTHYFKQTALMPQLAQLATYRGATPEQIMAIPKRHAYLRWWNVVTYDRLFVLWLAALATLVIVARTRTGAIVTASSATALLLTGLLMMLVNCFLTEPLPRYALPMFELTFLSLMLLLSQIAEAFAPQPSPPIQ